MIRVASRAPVDRWTKISFAIVCLAVALALATKPEPSRRRVVVYDTQVEILDDVQFVGDTIATRSLRTLDAVADTLIANEDIQLVEVQADTLARAQRCVDYLIGRGVAPSRLATGLKDGPIAAFLIVRRASE